MKRPQKLIFSVTNDLSYDQRMIRICSSLAKEGYHVTLVGRKVQSSIPLKPMPFHQQRIRCFFSRGFIFYAEFNIKLFFYLLYKKANLVCAIDLDTILPCYFISVMKNIPRVYDAHELFCEMKEIVVRPRIYNIWKRIEKFTVPRFINGYTVNNLIAAEFRRMYRVNYASIRNLPILEPDSWSDYPSEANGRYIIYQGAVNEGRSFETLIPAMKMVDAKLVICGDGNFMNEAKELSKINNLEDKITFTGWLEPDELRKYTRDAYIGVNILENKGLNHQFSLSNRFFDYIQSGLPQVCVDYPAYRQINDEYYCALMIADTSSLTIAESLNHLLKNESLYEELKNNCVKAKQFLNWNNEEMKLHDFYKNILGV